MTVHTGTPTRPDQGGARVTTPMGGRMTRPVAPPRPTSRPCGCNPDDIPTRLRSKILVTNCCWIWLAFASGGAAGRLYGRTGTKTRKAQQGGTDKAHRVIYQLLRQTQLAPDEVIHHRCRQTLCVHPCHHAVTDQAGNKAFDRLDVCLSGRHTLDAANRTNHNQCRACMRERQRRQKWHKRGRPIPAAGTEDAEYLGCRCQNGLQCPLHEGTGLRVRNLRRVYGPPCCQTVVDNIPERSERERRRAAAEGSAVLTEADVVQIRVRFAAGERSRTLGPEFKILPSSVNRIVRGATWREAGGPIFPVTKYTPSPAELDELRRLYAKREHGGNEVVRLSMRAFAAFAVELVSRGAKAVDLSRAIGRHPNAVGIFLARRGYEYDRISPNARPRCADHEQKTVDHPRCPLHTPAAVAGQPEPPTRPEHATTRSST